VFFTLTVFDALLLRYTVQGKLSDCGVSDTTGAPMAVPVRLITCGLVGSESLIVTVPE
jgi:hypothetical protein